MTQKVVLKITSLAPLGDGVSTDNGQFYYVPGAIPGDLVEAIPVKKNKRDIFTKLSQIIEASPFRRTPPCSVFNRCGGCSLLHAEESVQREAKQQSLMRQFGRQGVPFVTAGPPLGYRRLARLHCRKSAAGKVELGFYEKNAHHIVDIDSCPILEERISAILPTLKNGMLKGIQQGTVRIASGNEGVFIHISTVAPPEPAFYQLAAKAVPTVVQGVVLDWNGLVSVIAGSNSLTVNAFDGTPIRLPSGGFGQANTFINDQLTATVSQWIRELGKLELLELFAGAGNFSFSLRHHLKKMTLVELDEQACQLARQNFKGIAGFQVTCGDAAEVYARIGADYPVVLLDPPRTGDADLAKAMAKNDHHAIIYVSCNPATLKRDLAHLLSCGYVLEELHGFDMFPQTAHMEAAALLRRH